MLDHSPPVNTIKFDFGDYPAKYDEINDVLRVAAEDLASQLTLIDLSIFVAIRGEELSSVQWNGSKKYHFSPNVVQFTQRFNRVSFWVVQEVLSHRSVKHRAEVLSHLIKVAKRLLELNNLHSAFAIKSALTSAPIHRLSKTWAQLSKKDKQSFERLSELFSDSDNFQRLRDHLSAARTPCIPYLGIYLHDIVYIDVAHPQTKGLENPNRTHKMNAILRIIAEFQRSSYDTLPIMPSVQKYLTESRYIEELQKFLEDDNFKLSLKLEPPENDTKSVFYVRANSHPIRSSLSQESYSQSSKHSIPSSASSSRLSVSFNSADTQTNAKNYFTLGHRKSHSLGTNVLSSLASIPISSSSKSLSRQTTILTQHMNNANKNRCLIDDSVISEEPIVKAYDLIPSLPKFDILCIDDDNEEPITVKEEERPLNTSLVSYCEDKIVFQGMVKRKTVLKEGKKPSVSVGHFCPVITGWVRYWLVLQGTHLFYFDPKYFKNNYRTNLYRSNPLKCRPLMGWFVALVEDPSATDTFTLTDSIGKNVYKFQAPTAVQAFEWYKRISQVLSDSKNSSRKTSLECLIDFEDDSSNKNRLQIPYASSRQSFN